MKENQEPNKPTVKTGSTQSAQTQTWHSTTQTPNIVYNHTAPQGTTHSHTHGPLPDLVKDTGPTHGSHTPGNHSSHACHKQANVEHVKRVSCNDLNSDDGDCSDSGSSQEDSCSTSSSGRSVSSRYCVCCYCEVFGHGVPSVAPVSRNYNEMRERLPQLLTKKKARKCKATCSPSKSPSEPLVSNTSTETTAAATNSTPRLSTPALTVPTVQTDQRDQRNLEELLEFIEGNQNGKKAEKEARQKQRKLQKQMNNSKQQAQNKICDSSKNNMKQESNNEKSNGKQVDEKKIQQQHITKTQSKSKKDKKNMENKENVLQQNPVNKNRNQPQNVSGKKQKANTPPQTPVSLYLSHISNINNDK